MKNTKAIIILIVLILLFLISGVSANDTNTTQEISASDTEEVASIVNDYLVDDLIDSDNIKTDSSEENLTVQNDVGSIFKENEFNSFNHDEKNNKELLSLSNSEILEINNDNDLLSADPSVTYSYIDGEIVANFNNVYIHFSSLSDQVMENIKEIYDLINSKENEKYLDENTFSNKINDEDFNLLSPKKASQASINNNESQSIEGKSFKMKSKRKYKKIPSAKSMNIKSNNAIGIDKFQELCLDEEDKETVETQATKKK